VKKRFVSVLGAAVLVSALGASAAQATFHENLIREVHEGGATGDYVELQSYAAGQNLVSGKYINSYDGGGSVLTSTLIPSNVANSANNATILVAHDASTPGADVIDAGLNVDSTGGTVCFSESPLGNAPALDCVYFGDPTPVTGTAPPIGNPSPVGSIISLSALPGGSLLGNSLIRSISRGCATLLDAADDTNNSAADFSIGTGNPRGNASPITETPCPPIPPVKTKKCPKGKKLKTIKKHGKKKKKCVKKKHHHKK
jgi:hypothetical protein